MGGTHHCLVAEIAYDGAPIVNQGGVTMSPANSDKLAQRNLQVTHSDNPGPADTHRVPQTFDARPSVALTRVAGDLLDYPDELMIDWGQVPLGSTAHIYWPAVDATAVLTLARTLYGSTSLTASDAHTVDAPGDPRGDLRADPAGHRGQLRRAADDRPADDGDLRAGVRRRHPAGHHPAAGSHRHPRLRGAAHRDGTVDGAEGLGREEGAAARRTATKAAAHGAGTGREEDDVGRHRADPTTGHRAASPQAPPAAAYRKGPLMTNWRYVTGTFQVKIPVTTAAVMLWPDENTLAIVRWRLTQMQPTNRWVPVLTRYAEYLAARIDGLGGDSTSIQPSPDGAPPTGSVRGEDAHTHAGRVVDVTFDCYGELEGFTIEACCGGRHTFPAREPGVRDLVLRALKERLTLVLVTEDDKSERICRIHVRF